jgi:hypothetical protein
VSGVVAALVTHGWRRVWVLDTEYKSTEGELQVPHCLCALDLISLERRDVWLTPGTPCPFSMAKDELFILYAADADILTFIAMPGWPVPLAVVDPRVEWIRIDNGGDQYKPGRREKKGYSSTPPGRSTFRRSRRPPRNIGGISRFEAHPLARRSAGGCCITVERTSISPRACSWRCGATRTSPTRARFNKRSFAGGISPPPRAVT